MTWAMSVLFGLGGTVIVVGFIAMVCFAIVKLDDEPLIGIVILGILMLSFFTLVAKYSDSASKKDCCVICQPEKQ